MTWKQFAIVALGAGCMAAGAAFPAASGLLAVGGGLIGLVFPQVGGRPRADVNLTSLPKSSKSQK